MQHKQDQNETIIKESVINENPEIKESPLKDSPLKNTTLFESGILHSFQKIEPMMEIRTTNPLIFNPPSRLQSSCIFNRIPGVQINPNHLTQSRRYSVVEHRVIIGQPIMFNQQPRLISVNRYLPTFGRASQIRVIPEMRPQSNVRVQYPMPLVSNIQNSVKINHLPSDRQPNFISTKRIKQDVEIKTKQTKMCGWCGADTHKQALVYEL